MPLYAVHALHYIAACDRCDERTALPCSHTMPSARRDAVERLGELGWRQRVNEREPAHTRAWVEAEGAGEWRCPTCARSTASA